MADSQSTMKYLKFRYTLIAMLVVYCPKIALGGELSDQDTKLAIRYGFTPREVRDYNLDVSVEGKAVTPDSTNPVDLHATFHLEIRHRYGRREGDGLLPIEITLLKGEAYADGGKLEIASSLYPKLTVLVDREWRINDILGIPDERIAQTLPGINYANHIILFYLPGADQPRSPGSDWSYTLRIPTLGESYEFTNSIVRQETVNGVRSAVVRQNIRRITEKGKNIPRAEFKASAESTFAVEGGQLMKSHVECGITFDSAGSVSSEGPSGQKSATSRLSVKIDILPVKRSSDS
ncbi:MAG: hypothetical protein ACUVRS_01095 [Armatimonadota bacterium]